MLHRILYYGLVIPFSKLPFPVLYFLSDFFCFILNRVIGYRKKVIYGNIRRSFPEKKEEEIKAIQNEFYAHFCDLIVESLKTFTISEKESLARVKIVNAEVIDRLHDMGKNITTIGGHNGNWELYAVACAMQVKADAVALYTPLSSAFFERVMKKSRSKFGLQMIPTREFKNLETKTTKPTMFIFGIDQCPRKHQRAYWMEFLNQETGVQYGAEKFARENDTAVVFGNIKKVKRGYYEIEYTLVCEDTKDKPEGWVIENGTKILENYIKAQPEYWLWSHKRWKHKKEDFDEFKDQPKEAEIV